MGVSAYLLSWIWSCSQTWTEPFLGIFHWHSQATSSVTSLCGCYNSIGIYKYMHTHVCGCIHECVHIWKSTCIYQYTLKCNVCSWMQSMHTWSTIIEQIKAYSTTIRYLESRIWGILTLLGHPTSIQHRWLERFRMQIPLWKPLTPKDCTPNIPDHPWLAWTKIWKRNLCNWTQHVLRDVQHESITCECSQNSPTQLKRSFLVNN